MEKMRRIVLYGNSVILGTVGASLRRFSQYEVVSVSPASAQDSYLESLAPDVILFDLEATSPQAAFSLLESRQGLLLIGVSPDSNLVEVWSGRQLREMSTRNLLEVIDGQLNGFNAH